MPGTIGSSGAGLEHHVNLRAMDLSDDLITLGHGRSANGLSFLERLGPHEALITLSRGQDMVQSTLVKGNEKDVARSAIGCRCSEQMTLPSSRCSKFRAVQ
jgi:hypothetical protein